MKRGKIGEKRGKSDPRPVLEALLAEASSLTGELRDLESEMEQRLAAVRAEYEERIRTWKAELDRVDKEIKKTAKAHEAELFDASQPESWVRLRHGTLIRSVEIRVKRARGVLERLEALGRLDAVKVAKSVDWSKLETWPDAELEAVGTERVERVRYGYDLAGVGDGKAKQGGRQAAQAAG